MKFWGIFRFEVAYQLRRPWIWLAMAVLIVFAFFGRGRVLTALHGKDLKAKELEEVAKFLCGACSCQVKELNPGIDLLFAVKWEAFLDIEITPQPREARTIPKR